MTARRLSERASVRAFAGLSTVLALLMVVVVAVGLFRGSFTKSVPVTVVADRAGLVMYPDAKVKLHGAQIGQVESIRPVGAELVGEAGKDPVDETLPSPSCPQ